MRKEQIRTVFSMSLECNIHTYVEPSVTRVLNRMLERPLCRVKYLYDVRDSTIYSDVRARLGIIYRV